MIETHDGRPSSRHRDLVDLLLITAPEPLDGPRTHLALHTEISRRAGRTGAVAIAVPDRFRVPGAWAGGYRAGATALPEHLRDLAAAEARAARFVNPLPGTAPPGLWHPGEQMWLPSPSRSAHSDE